jgi:UDP-N-acetylmuramate--alanine ligase
MDRLRRGGARADRGPAHAHLVGIADRGLSGLAQVLVQGGATVSGTASDDGPALRRLRLLGARVHAGHAPRRCPRDAHLLIYGPGVGRDHPERLAASRLGIAQEAAVCRLGRLMRRGDGVAVVGRRGAAVASAMIGWTLTRAGLDPTVILGTAAPQLGGWARYGAGPHVVVEAIEAPEGIGPTGPRLAVVLDAGPDPCEAVAAREAALRRFAVAIPPDGSVLAERTELIAAAMRGAGAGVEWLSLERGGGWWGADLREEGGRYRFRAFNRGRFAVELRLRVPGLRNVMPALAAVAACGRLDVPAPEIKQGLEEFAGVSRDFESRGSYRGVTLVDDQGRGASAVAEALAIGREVFGTRRLWAALLAPAAPASDDDGRLSAALAAADHVLIAEAGPPGGDGGGARALARSLAARGLRARWAARLDDAISELDRQLEPGDVLVTLGAGDVGTISDAFIRRLSRDRQGR